MDTHLSTAGGDNDDRIYTGDGSDVIHGDNNFPTPFAGND
jgi:hypothetical protein